MLNITVQVSFELRYDICLFEDPFRAVVYSALAPHQLNVINLWLKKIYCFEGQVHCHLVAFSKKLQSNYHVFSRSSLSCMVAQLWTWVEIVMKKVRQGLLSWQHHDSILGTVVSIYMETKWLLYLHSPQKCLSRSLRRLHTNLTKVFLTKIVLLSFFYAKWC